jgi:DNA-binding transcriptional ArsR family regulator
MTAPTRTRTPRPAARGRDAPDGPSPGPSAPGRIWLEDDALRAGYTQCLNALLPATALSPPDKIVFFGVLSFAWQDDAAWPSVEQLAARVGLARTTVIQALGELKRHGLLRVRRRGQGMVNLYQIPRLTRAVLDAIGVAEPAEPDDEPEDEDLVEIEDLTEAKGFTPLSNLILSARGLDAADKLVYVGLGTFAMRKGRCRLRMTTLASRTAMSRRSVVTHVGPAPRGRPDHPPAPRAWAGQRLQAGPGAPGGPRGDPGAALRRAARGRRRPPRSVDRLLPGLPPPDRRTDPGARGHPEVRGLHRARRRGRRGHRPEVQPADFPPGRRRSAPTQAQEADFCRAAGCASGGRRPALPCKRPR